MCRVLTCFPMVSQCLFILRISLCHFVTRVFPVCYLFSLLSLAFSVSHIRSPGWFLYFVLTLLAGFWSGTCSGGCSPSQSGSPCSSTISFSPCPSPECCCHMLWFLLSAQGTPSSILSAEPPTVLLSTTLFLMEFHRYFLLHAPLSACTYRSHGSQCSRVLGELILFGLSLSQVMRRSHEAREKLLRLGIFRQVDVLIDTCHGRYHGRVSRCYYVASGVTEQSCG